MFSQVCICSEVGVGVEGWGEYPPPNMAPATYGYQAGGTQPTGMLSGLELFFVFSFQKVLG